MEQVPLSDPGAPRGMFPQWGPNCFAEKGPFRTLAPQREILDPPLSTTVLLVKN